MLEIVDGKEKISAAKARENYLEENGVPFAHLEFYDDGYAIGIQYEIKDE